MPNGEASSTAEQRISRTETDVGILQADARTTASVLNDIARQLEKLTAGQSTSPTVIFTLFCSGVLAASILFAGLFFLIDARIFAQTALLNARVTRIEAAIIFTPSFTTVIEKTQK